jgi:hypothetical protein
MTLYDVVVKQMAAEVTSSRQGRFSKWSRPFMCTD